MTLRVYNLMQIHYFCEGWITSNLIISINVLFNKSSINANFDMSYHIDNRELSKVIDHRDLDVNFTENLSWHSNYEAIIAKTYKSLALLK